MHFFNGISTFCFTLTVTINLVYVATVAGLTALPLVLVLSPVAASFGWLGRRRDPSAEAAVQ